MCVSELFDKERHLHIGQAEDALHEVHRQLRVSSTILEFKRGQHAASQRITTKTQHLMVNFRSKTHGFAERYIATFRVLEILNPGGSWTEQFKPLDIMKDLHLPRHEEDDPRGENQRELSWIWQVLRSGNRPMQVAMEDEINDSTCYFILI